ncbi:MAG: hypothetical protein JXB38_16330 [Anaerolineales bacterium]|nr:hypothetical protein [Anaerolineales bacterium]
MPEDKLTFNIPIPNLPRGKPIPVAQVETILLSNLSKKKAEFEFAMINLAWFYSRIGRQDISYQYISQLLQQTDDLEKQASYYLKLGQLMEQVENYEAAIVCYRDAFSIEKMDSWVWYYINNNLGYCLNQYGKFEESEPYFHEAIRIDAEKHNAYKNLGISLEGQGKYLEAAKSFIKATEKNAGDSRAFVQLDNLIMNHSSAFEETPYILDQAKKCRQAVELANQLRKGKNQ